MSHGTLHTTVISASASCVRSKGNHKNVAVRSGKWSTSSSKRSVAYVVLVLTFWPRLTAVESWSVTEFRPLALESSFPTAERRVDTNEDEGSSSIDYHKAFSVHLHNAGLMYLRPFDPYPLLG